MKTRKGFVSNSSSTSFIIENKTSKNLKIKDFTMENDFLIDRFNLEYGDDVLSGEAISSAETDYADVVLSPGKNECVFGDEQGTTLGRIYDYILRDGGESKSFKWYFKEYLR